MIKRRNLILIDVFAFVLSFDIDFGDEREFLEVVVGDNVCNINSEIVSVEDFFF